MLARFPRAGRVEWIGLRPARREPVRSVERAEIGEDGLVGDHGRPGKRAVTLIQAEHLPVIAAPAGTHAPPELLRRNVAISGINLYGLRKLDVRLGDAVVRIEGPCPPCSRIEEYLGPGGYNAVRGHGGWYASVVAGGALSVGDGVRPA